MDEPPRDEFVLQILRYVVAHPTAKDTVRGIEKWWLSKSLSREARKKIECIYEVGILSKEIFRERG